MDKLPESVQKYASFLLGLIPLVLGFLYNYLMMLPFPWILWQFIGFILLVLWGVLARKTAYWDSGAFLHTVKMNALGLVLLVLVLVQELAVHHYFDNLLGILSQSYFLPFMWPALMIESIWAAIAEISYLWQSCVIAYCLMFAASYVGSRVKRY